MLAGKLIKIIENAYNDGTIPKDCGVGEIYGSIRSTLLRKKTGTCIKEEFLDSLARGLMATESSNSIDRIAEGVRFWVKVWSEYRQLEKAPIRDSWECKCSDFYPEMFRYEVREDEDYLDMPKRATVCYNWNKRDTYGVCEYDTCDRLKFTNDRQLQVTACFCGNTVTKVVSLNEFIKPDYPIGYRFFDRRGIGVKDLESICVKPTDGAAGVTKWDAPAPQGAPSVTEPAKKPLEPQKPQVVPKIRKSGVAPVFNGNVVRKQRGSLLGVAWAVLGVVVIALGVYVYLTSGTKHVKVEKPVQNLPVESQITALETDKMESAKSHEKPRFHALGYSKVISKQAPVYRTREDARKVENSAGALTKGKRVYIVEVEEKVCGVKSSPESKKIIWMEKADIAANSQKP